MLSVILGSIDQLAGGHLAWLAWDVHAFALSLVALFAFLPFFQKAFSKLNAEDEKMWVKFWICPECGQLNRRTFLTCQRCEKMREISRWKSWFEELSNERIKPTVGFLLGLLRGIGWIIFYGSLGLAIVGFRLFDFHQYASRELLASLALIFLLLALLYFRSALRPVLKSPLTFVTDLIGGVILSAFFLSASLLWAAVPYRMHRPLASIQTTPTNIMRVQIAGRPPTTARNTIQGKNMTWAVQYAELTWPLFGTRQIFLMRLADQPMEDSWLLNLLERSAPYFQTSGATRLRLVLFTQTLSSAPSQSYVLAEDPFGNGLTLTPKPVTPVHK